ncbi:MAG TPA: hypothetical protein VF314_14825 [Actinomycetes bacterium]
MRGSSLLLRWHLVSAAALLILGTVGAPLPAYGRAAQQAQDGAATPPGVFALAIPVYLEFGQQPTDTRVGNIISPSVTVEVFYPSDGAAVPESSIPSEITLTLDGGRLGGSTTRAVVGDVATFGDLFVAEAAAGLQLTATADGLAPVTSNPFDVTRAEVAELVFEQQPNDTLAGRLITPPVTVELQDSDGHRVVDASSPVSLTLAGRGQLGGRTTRAAVDGLATFDDLSVEAEGTGQRLVARAGGLRPAESDPFDVTRAAEPIALVFTQQPTATVAGEPVAPSVVVEVRDGSGARVSEAGSVTIGLADAPLSGTTTRPTENGRARFDDLVVERAGVYVLEATVDETSQESRPFEVTAASAARLALLDQPPSGRAVGEPFDGDLRVAVLDRFGNRVGGDSIVLLAVTPGTGAAGARLVCETGERRRTVDGVATFERCYVDQAGADYTLTATAVGLPGEISEPFGVGIDEDGGGLGTSTILFIVTTLLLLAAAAAAIAHRVRARRTAEAARVRAEMHPDTARVLLDDPHPELSHDVQLEPHADPGAWTLRDR